MSGGDRTRLAMIAAALVGVQVGAATVASRFAITETDPISLALWRYMIGVLCLAPFVLASARPRFALRDLAPIAALGTIQFGVLIALLNYGLQFIPAGRAALVFACFPLLTMLLAAALGRETLSLAKSSGVALTMAGVGLALGEKALGHTTEAGGAGWNGETAVLGAAACGAICSVLYRPYLQRYPTLAVSAVAMLTSVVCLALMASGLGVLRAPVFSPRAWAAVVFIGLSSGIGYYVWLWALANTTPTRVTVFQALAPITAALLGWALLGETLSPAFVGGLALVAIGLWVAQR